MTKYLWQDDQISEKIEAILSQEQMWIEVKREWAIENWMSEIKKLLYL